MELKGNELRWRYVGLFSEGSEEQSDGTEKLCYGKAGKSKDKLRKGRAGKGEGYEWSGMAAEKL